MCAGRAAPLRPALEKGKTCVPNLSLCISLLLACCESPPESTQPAVGSRCCQARQQAGRIVGRPSQATTPTASRMCCPPKEQWSTWSSSSTTKTRRARSPWSGKPVDNRRQDLPQSPPQNVHRHLGRKVHALARDRTRGTTSPRMARSPRTWMTTREKADRVRRPRRCGLKRPRANHRSDRQAGLAGGEARRPQAVDAALAPPSP